MKDFLKFTLATVTGIILSSIVLFIIGMVTLFGIMAASDTETIVKKNSVMILDLNGTLVERTQEDPLGILSQLFNDDSNTYGLDDILSSIKKAKENEDIKGIYLQANSLGTSYASLQEIRNALLDFKESGKFVIAYADSYTQGLYYLSSAADKVLLNPKGMIEWRGIASTPLFYKDLLQKIGVEMQIFKVGTYKSAVEPFIATEMSPANREQVTTFISSIWSQVTEGVSASRNIPVDSLKAYADRMLMFYPAEESVRCGLADTLVYRNDVRDYLKRLVDIDEDDNLSLLGLGDMINVRKNVPKDKSGNIIAVYYASGEITDYPGSATSEEGIVGSKVIRDLRKLKDNDDVKAVVLRVNSPGGSAFASEQIWYAVKELKTKKPVIVSMGDYAASGGYYISCGADTIVAEPTTLTGSIGIFGMVPNVKELTDKIGLSYDVVKTNKYADFGNIMRPFSEGEKALLQMMVAEGYDTFITRCAEGRHTTKEAIEKIAEGRVWTGEAAKELGLVDELGGIDKALDIAIAKARVGGYTIVSYPTPLFYKDLLQKIGVEMQIFKVGTYKSAVEPFIATEMSPANREQVTTFISSIWSQVTEGVSASRNIPVDSLKAYADRMLMFYPAEESVRCGLADTLVYRNDVRDYLKRLVDIDEDDNLSLLGLGDMINVRKNVPKDKSGNIIAVYYASGEITDYPGSATSEEGIVGSKVIRDLRKLKDNDDVKAVVLRVNSPGGSAFASEQIWYAVKELKTKKPVIVSMGDYAASGGYYISCGADTIVAEPTTLTGSIGIFGMVPNVKELTDKIGLSYDVVKTNKYADFGNIMRPFSEGEKALLQMMVAEGYDTFITRCAEGRHTTKEAIEKIAEGRVWTGEAAKELGLVDELGGIDKALDIAIAKARVGGYTIVSYPEKKDVLSSLLDTKPTNYVESQLLKSKLGEYYRQFGLLTNLKEQSMIQARVPFELNIK